MSRLDSLPGQGTMHARDHGPRRQWRRPQVYRQIGPGCDIERLALSASARVTKLSGLVAVLLDPDGRCWCVGEEQGGFREFVDSHADWLVGTYRSVRSQDLLDDLKAHRGERVTEYERDVAGYRRILQMIEEGKIQDLAA